MHYKAKRGRLFYVFCIVLAILPFALFAFDPVTFREKPFILLPLIAPFALTLWIFLDTHYKMDDTHVHYTSAFIRGKVKIRDIKKVEQGKTLWVGMIRPALATKGIIIHYQSYEQLYIAPENNAVFVRDLLALNPNIALTKD